MSAPERRRYVGVGGVLLLFVVAFVLFILAECAAQGWLTKGTPAEWFIGGWIALTAALMPL